MYNVKSESLRDRVLRRIIICIVVATFMIPLITPECFAASSVSITGGDNVKGGETFTVTVTYGGNVDSVRGEITYDTNKLTYISGGSSSGNVGSIEIKEDLSSNGSITFNIQFQAVSEGSTKISVNTIEMYDSNFKAIGTPSASKTVNVTGAASEDQLVKEERSSDTPAPEVELYGVDEKGDEPGDSISTNIVLMVSAGILAVIIGIIIAVLIYKRKRG